MITIITPSCRQQNIPKLFDSIRFDHIEKWIIVYDTTKGRTYKRLYPDHPKILELECNDPGTAGHPQRNYAMPHVTTRMYYFLDDDNVIHPHFWDLLPRFQPGHYYTFDQLRNRHTGQVLTGDQCRCEKIDTAQFVLDKELTGDLKWRANLYNADGLFIEAVHSHHPSLHVYIPEIACYYNALT